MQSGLELGNLLVQVFVTQMLVRVVLYRMSFLQFAKRTIRQNLKRIRIPALEQSAERLVYQLRIVRENSLCDFACYVMFGAAAWISRRPRLPSPCSNSARITLLQLWAYRWRVSRR